MQRLQHPARPLPLQHIMGLPSSPPPPSQYHAQMRVCVHLCVSNVLISCTNVCITRIPAAISQSSNQHQPKSEQLITASLFPNPQCFLNSWGLPIQDNSPRNRNSMVPSFFPGLSTYIYKLSKSLPQELSTQPLVVCNNSLQLATTLVYAFIYG